MSTHPRLHAKAAILQAALAWMKERSLSLSATSRAFAEAYNAGKVELPAEATDLVRKLGRDTVATWAQVAAREGVERLGGAYGNRKGTGQIDSQPELLGAAQAWLAGNPRGKVGELLEHLTQACPGASVPSLDSTWRWLQAQPGRQPRRSTSLAPARPRWTAEQLSLPGLAQAARDRLCEFEGVRIDTLTYRGRPVWTAGQVGLALGYEEDARRFVDNLTGVWAEELEPGKDFFKLEGEDLRAFKKLREQGDCARNPRAVADELGAFKGLPGENDPASIRGDWDRDTVPVADDSGIVSPFGLRTRNLILLTEQGVWTACLLSRKPAGRRLRRWLADEVLPSLARSQSPSGGAMLRTYPIAGAAGKSLTPDQLALLGQRAQGPSFVRALMAGSGVRQKDIAAELGLSTTLVSMVVRGVRKNERVEGAIAGRLGLSPAEVWR
jgi:hypothetical protein